jgi:hypothetical protein
MDDTSITDWRAYIHLEPAPLALRQGYITEYETRFTLSNLDAADPAAFAFPYAMVDGIRTVLLYAVRFGGVLQLGIIGGTAGIADPTQYLALVPFDFDGRDTHLRIKIDRDDNPSTYGKIQVFVDYAETPLLEELYYDVVSPGASGYAPAVFGTEEDWTARFDLDYASWTVYKKRGDAFRGWADWNFSTNEIVASTTDPDIVKPVEIVPPGITVGQSEHACLLDVQAPVELCEVKNDSFAPAVGPTYKIDVIYKMDIAATEGELVVQRSSDLYYWDETGGVWDPNFQSVTLPNQLTRTRLAAMTGINVTVPDQQLLVTVARKTTAGSAYKIFVYKVHLVEE